MPPTSFLILLAGLAIIAIGGPILRKYWARKRTAKPDPLEENAIASVKENGGVYFSGEMFGQPSRNRLK